MEELVSGWANLLASTGIFQALDDGEAAVINLLGDDVDGFLQTAIPAYAAAVALCDATDVATGCTEKRIKLRNEGLKDLLVATGLIKLIDAAIKAWHLIPKDLREAVHAAIVVGEDVVNIFKQPSLASFYNTAVDAYNFMANYGMKTLHYIYSGAKAVGKMAKWLYKYGSELDSDVKSLLREAGLGAMADFLDKTKTPVATLVSAYKAGKKDIVQAVNDFKHGNIGGALAELGKTATDAVTTVTGDVTSALTLGLL